jgi:hypothetical protein
MSTRFLRMNAVALAGMLFLSVGLSESAAYEEVTHEALAERGATQSSMSSVLVGDLGLDAGIDTVVRGQTLNKWLRRGASAEDDQVRSLNHFHNPLADWGNAGLLGNVGQSAILWAQNPAQGSPSWSWRDVRLLLFSALTKTSSAERENAMGALFEGLGRQVHLVQDSASPGHARNDPHVLYNY